MSELNLHTPDQSITVRTYEEFQDDLQAFADGKYNFLIVIGRPGIGKTETARELLDDPLILSGRLTAKRLYIECLLNIGKLIVLDDVSPSLYADANGQAILKSLTETRTVKTVKWQTGMREDIPDSFDTTSRVAIFANSWRSIDAHVAAIEGRATSIHFDPGFSEVHNEVGRGGWFRDEEVYRYVWDHRGLIVRPDMRLYRKIAEQKVAGRPWRKRALEMMIGDERLQPIAELMTDGRYTSNRQRQQEFTRRGYGGRSKFYELLKEFKRYVQDVPDGECPPLLKTADSRTAQTCSLSTNPVKSQRLSHQIQGQTTTKA